MVVWKNQSKGEMPYSVRMPVKNVVVRGRGAVTVISMTIQRKEEIPPSMQRTQTNLGLR